MNKPIPKRPIALEPLLPYLRVPAVELLAAVWSADDDHADQGRQQSQSHLSPEAVLAQVRTLIASELDKYEDAKRDVARARQANLQRLWSRDSVAELLDVPTSFVERLIRTGKLEGARLGYRTLRVTERSLRSYLKAVQGT